jgi:hypothetical protein
MLVHPWDASVSDDEWREWLGTIAPFGQLVVNNADPAHARGPLWCERFVALGTLEQQGTR